VAQSPRTVIVHPDRRPSDSLSKPVCRHGVDIGDQSHCVGEFLDVELLEGELDLD
jgi:hypothetical protein